MTYNQSVLLDAVYHQMNQDASYAYQIQYAVATKNKSRLKSLIEFVAKSVFGEIIGWAVRAARDALREMLGY